MKVYDKSGSEYSLTNKIGSGGEGVVYAIHGREDHVIKIYEEALSKKRIEKLEAMISISNPSLLKIAAWPIEIITDGSGNKCGVLIPRINDYKPIHELYNPAARKKHFPEADFAFLVNTAKNIVSVFGALHQNGIVMGDVNEGNILVSNSSLVKLIDCDSFQIEYKNRTYECEVGIPMYTPPELQGLTEFRQVIRTFNHDLFGMGILCFQVLFMGRHPFVGRYNGPDISLEKAIEKLWFAYGEVGRKNGVTPPGETLDYETIPINLQQLFDRSFGEGGLIRRPRPNDWLTELSYLKQHLIVCTKDEKHKYYERLRYCPWCNLESNGLLFFISSKISSFTIDNFDLNRLWQIIENIDLQREELINPEKISIRGKSLPIIYQVYRGLIFIQKIGALAIGLALVVNYPPAFFIWIPIAAIIYNMEIFTHSINSEKEKRLKEYERTKSTWDLVHSEWNREASGDKFYFKLKELRTNKEALLDLGNQYTRERKALSDRKQELQLETFLSRYFIHHYTISNIGDSRKQTLASYGIDTAADIYKLKKKRIPGFGPFLKRELFKWRDKIAQRFKFDPLKEIDQEIINRMNFKYEMTKRKLQNTLISGPEQLQIMKAETLRSRAKLGPIVNVAAREVAYAKRSLAKLS